MIQFLLVASVLLNVLLVVVVVALWNHTWELQSVVTKSQERGSFQANVANLLNPQASQPIKPTKKAFRAHKSFREVKQQYEDAHDPQRMSRQRVEQFAKAKESK